jgi:hypothetical protein
MVLKVVGHIVTSKSPSCLGSYGGYSQDQEFFGYRQPI